MDKYYFDFGTVIAVMIALIGSMIVISYAMVDNFYLRRELNEAYQELENKN
jgi:hypothetical protein